MIFLSQNSPKALRLSLRFILIITGYLSSIWHSCAFANKMGNISAQNSYRGPLVLGLARFQGSGNKTDRWKNRSSPSPRFTDFDHHLSMPSLEPIILFQKSRFTVSFRRSCSSIVTHNHLLDSLSQLFQLIHFTVYTDTPNSLDSFTRLTPYKINWTRATLGMEGWPKRTCMHMLHAGESGKVVYAAQRVMGIESKMSRKRSLGHGSVSPGISSDEYVS